MRVVIRLLKEFWLPFIAAAIWTVFVEKTTTFQDAITVFASTFFLVSWATGQFFRVQKQAKVEQDLTSAVAEFNFVHQST